MGLNKFLWIWNFLPFLFLPDETKIKSSASKLSCFHFSTWKTHFLLSLFKIRFFQLLSNCHRKLTHNNITSGIRMETGGNPRYRCGQCNLAFDMSRDLKIHKLQYHGIRPYSWHPSWDFVKQTSEAVIADPTFDWRRVFSLRPKNFYEEVIICLQLINQNSNRLVFKFNFPPKTCLAGCPRCKTSNYQNRRALIDRNK